MLGRRSDDFFGVVALSRDQQQEMSQLERLSGILLRIEPPARKAQGDGRG
jgi:hypothetical protein